MRVLIITVSLLFGAQSFAQSAWNQQERNGYAQLSFSQIGAYDKLFSQESSDIQLSSEVEEQLIQFYGEYGITKDITLVLSIPFFKASISGGGVDDNHAALGNIRFGSRFHLYTGQFELSAQIDIDANTSDFDESTGISTGYDAWTLSPFISVGKGFGRFYAQAFLGANFRTDNFSHSFRLGTEIGVKILDVITVAGVVDVQKSLKNGDIVLSVSQTSLGLFVNDQEFVSTGIKILWDINKNYGVTASFLGATSGNFVPKRASTNFGFFAKF